MKRYIANIRNNPVTLYQVTDHCLYICKDSKKDIDSDKIHFFRYLENALPVAILLDVGKCLFDNQSISSNETIYSDGEWLWSADLNHYSKYHHFIWPAEFMISVQKRGYETVNIQEEQVRELEHLINDIDRKVYDEKYNVIYPGGKSDIEYPARTYDIRVL